MTGSCSVTGSGCVPDAIQDMIRDRNAALNLESFGLKALARDAGEVKPPEMPSVDGRAEMRLRSMASVNEEKDHGCSMEAPKLA